MNLKNIVLPLIAFSAVITCADVRASTIFSSFPVVASSPGSFSGVVIGGGAMNGVAVIDADQFTAATSGYLTSISVEAETQTGANALVISLDSNLGGTSSVPGAVLEQFTVAGQLSASAVSTVTGNSKLNPLLTAGSKYWLVVSVPNLQNDTAIWDFSASTAPSLVATQYSAQPGVWYTGSSRSGGMEAFTVSGSALPQNVPVSNASEPGGLLPAGLAGLAASVVGGRWRKARRNKA